MSRVTAFAVQSSGSRSFAVSVRGLRVLVTAEEGRHDDGAALAEAIACLGPEDAAPLPVSPVSPVEPAPVAAKPRRAFVVGQRVYCTVTALRGKACTITEVGTDRRRGYIKIAGERAWCPVHNFDANPPGGAA